MSQEGEKLELLGKISALTDILNSTEKELLDAQIQIDNLKEENEGLKKENKKLRDSKKKKSEKKSEE